MSVFETYRMNVYLFTFDFATTTPNLYGLVEEESDFIPFSMHFSFRVDSKAGGPRCHSLTCIGLWPPIHLTYKDFMPSSEFCSS